MIKLSKISDPVLGIDIRIHRDLAVKIRPQAGEWSFWPESPFGCSADTDVWPSVFTSKKNQNQGRVELLEEKRALYWHATGMWHDIHALEKYSNGISIPFEIIAIAIDRHDCYKILPISLLEQLTEVGITEETGNLYAEFMGYDITDQYLSSILFDGTAPEGIEPQKIQRTSSGLIELYDTAKSIQQQYESIDKDHAPFFVVSVWSVDRIFVI